MSSLEIWASIGVIYVVGFFVTGAYISRMSGPGNVDGNGILVFLALIWPMVALSMSVLTFCVWCRAYWDRFIDNLAYLFECTNRGMKWLSMNFVRLVKRK